MRITDLGECHNALTSASFIRMPYFGIPKAERLLLLSVSPHRPLNSTQRASELLLQNRIRLRQKVRHQRNCGLCGLSHIAQSRRRSPGQIRIGIFEQLTQRWHRALRLVGDPDERTKRSRAANVSRSEPKHILCLLRQYGQQLHFQQRIPRLEFMHQKRRSFGAYPLQRLSPVLPRAIQPLTVSLPLVCRVLYRPIGKGKTHPTQQE